MHFEERSVEIAECVMCGEERTTITTCDVMCSEGRIECVQSVGKTDRK